MRLQGLNNEACAVPVVRNFVSVIERGWFVDMCGRLEGVAVQAEAAVIHSWLVVVVVAFAYCSVVRTPLYGLV